MSAESESVPTEASGAAPLPSQADERIFLWGASLLAAAVAGSVLLMATLRSDEGELPVSERRLADFNLTERSGRAVATHELRDKFLVVNFVHTGCSISCAMVNQRMAEVQKLVTGRGDVRLLSLTVDPGTDSPAVLTKFANQFGADPERWLFLTGDKRSVYQLIETSFLSRDTNATRMEMPGGFRKADHIALVDRDGRVRRYFPGMKSDTPAAIVKAINELQPAHPKY